MAVYDVGMPETASVTHVLQAIGRSEEGAAEKLLPLVYADLRRLAGARMADEMSGHTLQPTALVHEAAAVGQPKVALAKSRPLLRRPLRPCAAF